MFSRIKEMGWVLVRCKGRLVPFARVLAAAALAGAGIGPAPTRFDTNYTGSRLTSLAWVIMVISKYDFHKWKDQACKQQNWAHMTSSAWTAVKIPKRGRIGIPQRSGHTTANPLIPTSAQCNGQFEEENGGIAEASDGACCSYARCAKARLAPTFGAPLFVKPRPSSRQPVILGSAGR